MHRKNDSWLERETNSSPLTVEAYTAAADAITHMLAASSEPESACNIALRDLAHAMGTSFNADSQGHPSLSSHTHPNKPPTTIKEMQKRFDHLVNQKSHDIQSQDLCRAAADEGISAATSVMNQHAKSGKH